MMLSKFSGDVSQKTYASDGQKFYIPTPTEHTLKFVMYHYHYIFDRGNVNFPQA